MSAAKRNAGKRGTRKVSAANGESVRARAEALSSALACGVGCLPGGGVRRAEVALTNAVARTSMASANTVVALAGATGI